MTASRIFRYDLHNDVPGHTLLLEDQHRCGGFYTPDWEPPEQIEYGQTRGIQAESGGFMTGTEGWVKYRIFRNSDQDTRGLVYLYWTNPYFGITFGRTALATRRWTANCDEKAPAAGSSFSASDEAPPFGFSLSLQGTSRNGSPTDIDELGDLYRVPLAPVFIFGTGGIWERMEVRMKLSYDETSAFQFPNPGQRTRILDEHPGRSTWEGQWSDENVSVSVRHVWGRYYEVTVSDTTPGRAFGITSVCSLGTTGIAQLFDGSHVVEALVSSKNAGSSYHEVARANVALSGMSAALRTAGAMEGDGASLLGISMSPRLTTVGLKRNVLEIGLKESAIVDVLAASAVEQAKASNYTLWPAPTVALQLYKELEDGRAAGYRLLYQRVMSDGSVLGSTFLSFRPQVHWMALSHPPQPARRPRQT